MADTEAAPTPPNASSRVKAVALSGALLAVLSLILFLCDDSGSVDTLLQFTRVAPSEIVFNSPSWSAWPTVELAYPQQRAISTTVPLLTGSSAVAPVLPIAQDGLVLNLHPVQKQVTLVIPSVQHDYPGSVASAAPMPASRQEMEESERTHWKALELMEQLRRMRGTYQGHFVTMYNKLLSLDAELTRSNNAASTPSPPPPPAAPYLPPPPPPPPSPPPTPVRPLSRSILAAQAAIRQAQQLLQTSSALHSYQWVEPPPPPSSVQLPPASPIDYGTSAPSPASSSAAAEPSSSVPNGIPPFTPTMPPPAAGNAESGGSMGGWSIEQPEVDSSASAAGSSVSEQPAFGQNPSKATTGGAGVSKTGAEREGRGGRDRRQGGTSGSGTGGRKEGKKEQSSTRAEREPREEGKEGRESGAKEWVPSWERKGREGEGGRHDMAWRVKGRGGRVPPEADPAWDEWRAIGQGAPTRRGWAQGSKGEGKRYGEEDGDWRQRAGAWRAKFVAPERTSAKEKPKSDESSQYWDDPDKSDPQGFWGKWRSDPQGLPAGVRYKTEGGGGEGRAQLLMEDDRHRAGGGEEGGEDGSVDTGRESRGGEGGGERGEGGRERGGGGGGKLVDNLESLLSGYRLAGGSEPGADLRERRDAFVRERERAEERRDSRSHKADEAPGLTRGGRWYEHTLRHYESDQNNGHSFV